jgi:hypothetical protein
VPEFAEFRLADDTAVRLELAPVGQPLVAAGETDDLPEGFGDTIPVGRGSARTAEWAAGTLSWALRPLGLLLQEVHDSLVTVSAPPQEVSVEFGVQIGQDLKLGIVGANGQASMKVSATWRLPAAPVAPEPACAVPESAVRPEPAAAAESARAEPVPGPRPH